MIQESDDAWDDLGTFSSDDDFDRDLLEAKAPVTCPSSPGLWGNSTAAFELLFLDRNASNLWNRKRRTVCLQHMGLRNRFSDATTAAMTLALT